MKINKLVIGPLLNNCYILEINNNVIIIDPSDNFELIDKTINNRNVVAIFITHYHYDHVGALEQLKNKYNVKIYDYKDDEKNYIINDFNFDLIYTKGHSKDSVSFYFKKEEKLFCGDFIFRENIGRCDLPGGDFNEMLQSIKKIKKYDECTIYTGHEELTTLSHEKKYNPYFNEDII